MARVVRDILNLVMPDGFGSRAFMNWLSSANFSRASVKSNPFHRAQSFFFYLPHLLHKFFPWSAIMLGLATADLPRAAGTFARHSAKCHPERLAVLWSIAGSSDVDNSLEKSRRIFPVIPPLVCWSLPKRAFLEWRKTACAKFSMGNRDIGARGSLQRRLCGEPSCQCYAIIAMRYRSSAAEYAKKRPGINWRLRSGRIDR